MTKILIINYFFGDERVPTGRMVNDICDQLKNKNIKFKVFSSGNKYKNIDTKKVIKKYEIRSPSFTNFSFINYILFFISVLFHVHRNNYQKFLILTDPPFLILISPFQKLLRTTTGKIIFGISIIGIGGFISITLQNMLDI